MRSRRALIGLLSFTVLVVLAATVAGSTVALELALFAGPFLLVAGLLVSGRYVGAERILARRAVRAPRPRPAPIRWSRGPERTLASLLERAPQSLRGPPAPRIA